MSAAAADWYPDPLERHQYRYWNGTEWTAHVSNQGTVDSDPLSQSPPAPRAKEVVGGGEQVEEQSPVEPQPEEGTVPWWCLEYASACESAMQAGETVIEIANRSVAAWGMANQRPQHEISIENFRKLAEEADREFVDPYRAFEAECAKARSVAMSLRAAVDDSPFDDVELAFGLLTPDERWRSAGVAIHLLRTSWGSTPATFIESLHAANAAIQADVFGPGDPQFEGHVWAPPPITERDCPYCAETIKAAAVVCRFCNRDLEQV